MVSSTHSLTNQLFKRVQSGVLFFGWNENLQPHGPFWNQFDTSAVRQQLGSAP